MILIFDISLFLNWRNSFNYSAICFTYNRHKRNPPKFILLKMKLYGEMLFKYMYVLFFLAFNQKTRNNANIIVLIFYAEKLTGNVVTIFSNLIWRIEPVVYDKINVYSCTIYAYTSIYYSKSEFMCSHYVLVIFPSQGCLIRTLHIWSVLIRNPWLGKMDVCMTK